MQSVKAEQKVKAFGAEEKLAVAYKKAHRITSSTGGGARAEARGRVPSSFGQRTPPRNMIVAENKNASPRSPLETLVIKGSDTIGVPEKGSPRRQKDHKKKKAMIVAEENNKAAEMIEAKETDGAKGTEGESFFTNKLKQGTHCGSATVTTSGSKAKSAKTSPSRSGKASPRVVSPISLASQDPRTRSDSWTRGDPEQKARERPSWVVDEETLRTQLTIESNSL